MTLPRSMTESLAQWPAVRSSRIVHGPCAPSSADCSSSIEWLNVECAWISAYASVGRGYVMSFAQCPARMWPAPGGWRSRRRCHACPTGDQPAIPLAQPRSRIPRAIADCLRQSIMAYLDRRANLGGDGMPRPLRPAGDAHGRCRLL